MKMVEFFSRVITTGIVVLGVFGLITSVCADFDPDRAVAGCALLVTAYYIS